MDDAALARLRRQSRLAVRRLHFELHRLGRVRARLTIGGNGTFAIVSLARQLSGGGRDSSA